MSKIRIIGMILIIVGIVFASLGLITLSLSLAYLTDTLVEVINGVIEETILGWDISIDWISEAMIGVIGLTCLGVGAICFAFIKEK